MSLARDIVEDLQRPEAYPEPRPARVGLATTHASWVFLTEAEVWKVKRPVNFGFLDFSTAEARHRCCEAEVRLGVRLAPHVYRGVVPLYRREGHASFVGPGEIIDHAVRMRRLPDAESARALLTAGVLGPAHLRQLAERLARFYGEVPAVPDAGGAGPIADHIDENERQMRPFEGQMIDRPSLETLFAWQRARLQQQTPRLAERTRDGRVRDGHGDLRLEHVYFLPNEEPQVIDPIEFNRSFRCADVALDASFLAMELASRQREDLAAAFMSSFAREMDDHDLYPLLDLFVSYRATVRAKVAGLVARDPSTPTDKVARKEEEARALFALALAFAQPRSRVSTVIAVGGQVGTGKSTMADALAVELGLPVVSSDYVRKHLAGRPLHERGGADLYTAAFGQRTYAETLKRADLVLQSGRGVVLDATFGSAEHRAQARALAQAHGRRFLFVHMTCGEELLRSRLRARAQGPSVSDADEAVLDALRASYTPPDELDARERFTLDAAVGAVLNAGSVRRHLGDSAPARL